MKYIDADKLIAEIDRRIKLIPLNYVEVGSNPTSKAMNQKLRNGLERGLNSIKDFIASLQQEQLEADLEKEIDRVFFQKDCGSDRLYHKEIAQLAKHFYELGLNARKEK